MGNRLVLVGIVMMAVSCRASFSAQGKGSASAAGDGDATAGNAQSCPAPAPPNAAASTTDRGTTPEVGGNHDVRSLPAGVYKGDLVVGGNHVLVCGAGTGQTIIDGALILSGNHNRITGVTARKHSTIKGNHNSAQGCEFLDGVDLGGNHNEH